MIDKQSIILGFYRHGKSKKQLSRELGINLKTIRKYIKRHEKEMTQSGLSAAALPKEGIISPPKYDASNRKKVVLTPTITKTIDTYLAQNEQKRSQGKHKQQLKKIDIHEALEEAGHLISYSTVCRYIRQQERKNKEVFIRQLYHRGQAVEFDWGEVKLTINGMPKRMLLAVFTSCYSNHRWARLYERQDMSSFLDSHAQYFDYTGGVQQQVVYDNMRTVVRKFAIKNIDKQPTEALLKMSCYYQFDYRFCNARKGNEKGHVERSVEYVRRKAFALLDDFDSLSTANTHLLRTCERLNQKPLTGKTIPIQQVFEEELEHMKIAVAPYDTAELNKLRVDKYSCIKVDCNWYSVQEGYVGQMLETKIYPDKILIYSPDDQLLAKHIRQTTRFEYYLQIEHYLETLRIKPGALLGALTLQQADEELQNLFYDHFVKRPKLFVKTLLYLRKEQLTIHQFSTAIDQCLKACPHQEINIDKLNFFLQNFLQKEKASIQLTDSSTPTEEVSKEISHHCTQQLQEHQALIFSS